MNLKVRFALLFTSFVAFILIISSAAIYILYYNYRLQDFYRRVKNEGEVMYQAYIAKAQTPDSLQKKSKENRYALSAQSVIIFDSAYHVLNKEPDTTSVTLGKDFFTRVKLHGEYRFQEQKRESVGFYMQASKMYVYSSAYDKFGLKKLKNVKIILLAVLAGSLLLTVFFSLFFVSQAFRPLRKLSEQMQRTTELNMAERVEEGKGNDEIKQIARSYNAMIERLRKAFDYQKSFVNHASHELRTPLASMLSQTEAAFNKNLDEAGYRDVLTSLKEDQQEMIELTNSLLLLSQYEKMTKSTEWLSLRIDEVLYDTIKAAKKIFPEALLTLEFLSIPEEENLLIKGNEALMRSAIRNLIKNAYQYSVDRNVSIFLRAENNVIEIIVDNVGPQVPVEDRDKLFMPFFRSQNSMEKRGHGLGLAIVQRIVDVHKGTVTYIALNNNINRFVISLYK